MKQDLKEAESSVSCRERLNQQVPRDGVSPVFHHQQSTVSVFACKKLVSREREKERDTCELSQEYLWFLWTLRWSQLFFVNIIPTVTFNIGNITNWVKASAFHIIFTNQSIFTPECWANMNYWIQYWLLRSQTLLLTVYLLTRLNWWQLAKITGGVYKSWMCSLLSGSPVTNVYVHIHFWLAIE